MSLQANKELWQSWSALWNGNLSIADEIIAANFVAHFAPIGKSPGEVHGPAGLKQWIGATGGAFTDASFTTTVGPLADEDNVAGRWLFRATYQGGHARSFAWCSWETGRVLRGWIFFASKLGKSSNIGCVQTRCNCCNKSGWIPSLSRLFASPSEPERNASKHVLSRSIGLVNRSKCCRCEKQTMTQEQKGFSHEMSDLWSSRKEPLAASESLLRNERTIHAVFVRRARNSSYLPHFTDSWKTVQGQFVVIPGWRTGRASPKAGSEPCNLNDISLE